MSISVVDVKFTDNAEQIRNALESTIVRILNECGELLEAYAKDIVPVDTGNLRASIQYIIDVAEKSVYIGVSFSDADYAHYVELGTYKMAAQPYLKPAVVNNVSQIRGIIDVELKKG